MCLCVCEQSVCINNAMYTAPRTCMSTNNAMYTPLRTCMSTKNLRMPLKKEEKIKCCLKWQGRGIVYFQPLKRYFASRCDAACSILIHLSTAPRLQPQVDTVSVSREAICAWLWWYKYRSCQGTSGICSVCACVCVLKRVFNVDATMRVNVYVSVCSCTC